MSRSPGTLEDKTRLFRRLDEVAFTHLVADYLAFIEGHSEVRVVDGPGDGRRDIQSLTPDGDKFLTQCKFHKKHTGTVSSRETDELPIALLKFNTKFGLFATNGRLSPQAKREYIENFPGFTLRYLDGGMLADAILTHPLLRAAWFDGQAIQRTTELLALPLVARRLGDDAPVALRGMDTLALGERVAILRHLDIDASVFAPYRPSTALAIGPELHGSPALVVHGAQFYELDKLWESLVQTLPSRFKPGTAVRIGHPVLVHPKGPSDYSTGLVCRDVPCETYVIDDVGIVRTEEDHLLPEEDFWKFPERVTTLTADWCHWYNGALDCVLTVSIATAASTITRNVDRAIRDTLARSPFAQNRMRSTSS